MSLIDPIDRNALMVKLGIVKNCEACEHHKTVYCDWKPNAVDVCEAICDAPTVEPQQRWIPVSERLPEEAYPVIVTWKNDDPASYYQYILGKHYVGVAHYKNGKWFWYSSITEDVLMEYGRCDSEEFDEAIEVLAWMPLPEPYREEGD